MRKQYTNPPVTEAVCEFRLSPDTGWDLTVSGLLYEKLRGEFSIKEQRLFSALQISQGPEGLHQQNKTEERVLFFNESRNVFVQVGARLLAINCLKPYPGWNDFSVYIEKAFDALKGVIEIKGLQRLGLRYINHIEISSSNEINGVDIDDYFEFRPFLGPGLPQRLEEFLLGCTLQYEQRRDLCKIALSRSIPNLSSSHAFSLDLDYYMAMPMAVSIDQALKWVDETAHMNLETAFEGCITGKLREIFQEVK